MIFDYLFLPVLFFIALITSYQDLRYGKIKNKWIILGLIYGLSLVAIFFVWDLVAHPLSQFYYLKIKHLSANSPMPVFTVSLPYLKALIINFFLSVAVAFLMWWLRAWSAGDTKLFFVLALLLPLKYYTKTYFPFFPALALLTNIFIPIFIFFAVKALLFFGQVIIEKIRAKKIKSDFNRLDKSKIVDGLRLFIAFTAMLLLAQFWRQSANPLFSLNSFTTQITALAAMYLLSPALTKILRRSWVLWIFVSLFLVTLVVGFVYFKNSLVSIIWQALYLAFIFLVLIGLVRKILDFYIKERGVSEIAPENLKPHSQISQEFLLEIKKGAPEIYQAASKERYWSPESLALIKKFCLERNQSTIKVYKSFPFAVWMMAGLIITIILKGSILSLIFKML